MLHGLRRWLVLPYRTCGLRNASSPTRPVVCVVANDDNPALPSMPKSLANFVIVTQPSHFKDVAEAEAVVHLPGSFGALITRLSDHLHFHDSMCVPFASTQVYRRRSLRSCGKRAGCAMSVGSTATRQELTASRTSCASISRVGLSGSPTGAAPSPPPWPSTPSQLPCTSQSRWAESLDAKVHI